MYLPSNSAAISLTNYGARGDGLFDNKQSILAAFSGLYASNGGTLTIPKGNYYFSGTVDLTGRDISIFGEVGARFVGALDENAKKINISGANRIRIESLTFDANRVGTNNSTNQNGFLNTYNSENITIANNRFLNTRNSAIYLGGGSKFIDVRDNTFTGYFCAIFGYINSTDQSSQNFSIQDNTFGDTWIQSANESAAIKIQCPTASTGQSQGHIINGNSIDSTAQMGIELWGRGRNNVVTNNSIKNTTWGVSMDGQEYSTVGNNTVKNISYMGFEAATLCKYVSFIGNVVAGYSGESSGVRLTQYGMSTSNTVCQNISYVGNQVVGCSNGLNIQNTVHSIISDNVIRDSNVNLFFQGNSYAQCYGNYFDVSPNTGVNTTYHIFGDASSKNLTGFHVAHNKFRGKTTDQSLFFYNAGNGYRIYDVLIENNITDSSTSGGYDTVLEKNNIFSNYNIRNNFGPSGGTAANTIQDASDSLAPYKSSDIYNGYTYYGTQSYPIPSAGLTGNSAWLCIWSGGVGIVNLLKARVSKSPDGVNNTATNVEISATFSPYNGLSHSLVVSPQSSYNGSNISRVRTQNHDSNATNSLWIKLNTIPSGADPLTIGYSAANRLTSPFLTYVEPTWGSSSAVVYNTYDLEATKSFNGYLTQSGSFIAGITGGRGAKLDIQANEPNVDLARFHKSNGDVAFALNQSGRVYSSGSSGDYAMIVQSFQGVTGAKGLKVSAGTVAGDDALLVTNALGTTLVRIDGVGQLGIGTASPTQALHVVGNILLTGNVTVGSGIVGAQASPPYIIFGTSYSSGSTRDGCKIYLYNDGGTEKYGFGVGSAGDIQYHSNINHDLYIANSRIVRINSSSLAVTGAISATTGLSLIGTVTSIRTASNLTNATTKETRWVAAHYLLAEEDMMVLYPFSDSTTNTIAYGGGAAANNAATRHDFYVAANNITVSGTLVTSITSTGLSVTGNLAFAGAPSFVAGSIYLNATNGLTIAGKTGATNDFLLTNNAGSTVLRNPTGGVSLATGGDLIVNGSLNISNSTAYANITSTTGTQQAYLQINNTGGTYYLAVDNSAGSALGFGAYNMGVYVPSSRNFSFYIVGTGVVGAFSSTGLTVTGVAGVTSFTGSAQLGMRVVGATSTTDYSGIDFSTGTQIARARVASYFTASGSYLVLGTSNNYATGITNSALTIDYTGAVTLSSSLLVTGGASIGVAALQVVGNQANQLIANLTTSITTAGQSFGLRVAAGTNASDYALRVLNQAGTLDYLYVKGDGTVSMGNGLSVTGSVTLSSTSNRLGLGGAAPSNWGIYNILSHTGDSWVAMGNGTTWNPSANGQTTYGVYSQPTYAKSTFTGLFAWGIFMNTPSVSGSGTIGSAAHIYMASMGGIATNNYGIYQGGTELNVFNGSIGCADKIIASANALDVSSSNAGFRVANPITATPTISVGAISSSQTMLQFVNTNGTVGSIQTSGTATSYNTSSDYRLKTNIRDIVDSGKIIDALTPRLFDWKTGDKDTYGFIAQEAYKIYPQMVTRGDDHEEIISKRWSIDPSKLIPVLTAEIKSLRERLAKLENSN